MARGNFGSIRMMMTMEKRLLIALISALVLGASSWAWGDTINWTFTIAGNYTVSDATKVEVVGGVAKLIAVDQTDNDNTSTGFGGGTHNQTQWDSGNNWLELQVGQSSGNFISRVMDVGCTAAWNSISWTPQRPLYKELLNNKGIESGYPEGNANMTGNVLLMHMNEASGTIVDYSGEGNNGTNSGALYSQTGKFNTALSFDGVDDYVEVPDNSSLDITDKITVEAWMKPSSDRWKYKKPITISGSSSGLTDHQVKVVVGYDSDMQADYDDLRFVDANGNILSYWIENYTASNATVWVKVPSIPTSGTTIYMYYGNPSASSASSGTNTFIFFDNFPGTSLDGAKWTATSSANVTVNNGVRINAGDIYTNSTVSSSPQNKIFEMKARYHNGTASYSGINIANAQSTQGSNAGSNALAYNMTQSGAAYNLTLWGANGTTASYNIVSNGNLGTPTLDTDYIIGFSFYGSTQISYFYQNTSYTDVNRLTYSGTWNQPFYLWLGYFTGSTAGGTDIDDITVRWVRVRKYASPEPSATEGNETAAGISKAGSYGIGANTTTAFASINNQMISGAISSGWNHITLTYDKNAGGTDEMKLYVNGVQTATKDYSTAISTNTNNLWVGDLFNGTIDEVAIYNRALTADEIADHYKRGVLRLKYQVRSGSTNPPTGNFIGPDSTTGTYYSELSNSTTGLPSLSLTNVSNNRYFQYKAYLETDNSFYSPELKSVVIGPTHYPGDNPTVQNNTGQTYAVLNSFVETLGAGNVGSVKYQISKDGTNWYYWNGFNWVAASGYSQANTAAEVNTNCGQFDNDVGTGDFYFKAFLHSDAAAQQVELDQVDLGYTPKVISVWVSDSTFTFGTNPLNTWLTPQISVITNAGTVAENFVGRISQLTDGFNTWAISSSTNGVDTIRAQWSTTSQTGPWTDISTYDTDFTIATSVAVNNSVSFWFRIQTPTSTSSYNEHSSTLTVTAQEY